MNSTRKINSAQNLNKTNQTIQIYLEESYYE